MTDTIQFRPYVSAEDQARANFYALSSRLLAAAPDAALLNAIAQSPPLDTDDVGAPLAIAWGKLIAVASTADPEVFAFEYEDLFGGVGKSPLNLHASHHLTGFMMEKPLVDVRRALEALGLSRMPSQSAVEDHLAALCEVMRILIVGLEGDAPRDVATQRIFFENQIAPWYAQCLRSVLKSAQSNVYKPVAEFVNCFLRVEQEVFSLDIS